MRVWTVGWLGVVLFVLLLSGTAHAMQSRPMNLEELTRQAGSIFVGRVEQVQEGLCGPHACTRYTFRVERNLLGAAAERFDAQFFGGTGTGGGAAMPLPGMPVLARGGRYLLFLRSPSRLGFSSPVGLSQGVFPLLADAQSGTRVSVAPTLIGLEGRGGLTVAEEQLLLGREVSLDALCRIVSRLLPTSTGDRQREVVK